MAKEIRIGIIGCGMMGRYHAEQYSKIPGAQVLAVTDILEPVAQKLAADLRLNPNFLCAENGGRQFALRLTVKNASTRNFEAELVCIP